MKKTLLVLSAIATLFAFVSCGKKGPSEPEKSDPANGDNGTKVNYLFKVSDWHKMSGYSETDAVIDGDNLKVTLKTDNQYNNMVYLPADVPADGITITFTCNLSSDSEGEKYTINFMDDSWKSLGAFEGTNKEPAEVSVELKKGESNGKLHQIQIFSQANDEAGTLKNGTLIISSIAIK